MRICAKYGGWWIHVPRDVSKPMEYHRGIEVGHTFKLGTKYSVAMKANYLNAEKESKPMVMGCYGIGISRVVAACIEQSHDAGGIVWPKSLAPWQLLVIPLNVSSAPVKEAAEKIYKEAQAAGIEVLLTMIAKNSGGRQVEGCGSFGNSLAHYYWRSENRFRPGSNSKPAPNKRCRTRQPRMSFQKSASFLK